MNKLITLNCCKQHGGSIYCVDDSRAIVAIVKCVVKSANLPIGFKLDDAFTYDEITDIQSFLLAVSGLTTLTQ